MNACCIEFAIWIVQPITIRTLHGPSLQSAVEVRFEDIDDEVIDVGNTTPESRVCLNPIYAVCASGLLSVEKAHKVELWT